MKKSTVFYLILCLAAVIVLAVGLLFFKLSLKYWLWSFGLLVFYTWNKDIILGIKWSRKKRTVSGAIPKFNEYEEHLNQNDPYDRELEKEGFLTLINCCVDKKFQPQLINFIENLETKIKDDASINLYHVIEFTYEKNISFIMQFDWKDSVEVLQIECEKCLQKNFDSTLELPKAEDYRSSTGVYIENVLEDFAKSMRRGGLQMGLIDTQSDEYIIIIHNVLDRERVANAVNKIGYRYLER